METSTDKILLESGTNEFEVLIFYLDKFKYGINGAKIREVTSIPKVRHVPGGHKVLEGLVQLRDLVIPLVSLRSYFDLGSHDSRTGQETDELTHQMIVTEFNEQKIAFRVDAIERIHRISWGGMNSTPNMFQSDRNAFTGLTVLGEDIVLIIDLEKIAEEVGEHRLQKIAQNMPKVDELTACTMPKKILYAEDSKMIQTMTVEILRSAGVNEVIVCDNGRQAWEWLEANQDISPVDIIITDVEMPQMDGLHLSNKIRQNGRFNRLPIVLLSSLISRENENKGKAVGVNAQLVKSKMETLPTLISGIMKQVA